MTNAETPRAQIYSLARIRLVAALSKLMGATTASADKDPATIEADLIIAELERPLRDELSAAQSALAEKEREVERSDLELEDARKCASLWMADCKAAEARTEEARERAIEECAKMLEALPVDKLRCSILNLPEQAWEEAQDQCLNAICALSTPPASPAGRKE